MTIQELADEIQIKLIILEPVANQSNSAGGWVCFLENVALLVKDPKSQHCVKFWRAGYGDTRDQAIENYIDKIRGKRLVFSATEPAAEIEYIAPLDLFRV